MSTIYQLSNNNFYDENPQIWGNNVVWTGYDGNNSEIFFYDGIKTVQLTDNETQDYSPQISGNNIVWQGNGSKIFLYDSTNWQGNGSEIFFYDGTNIIQLTNNNFYDENPQISGNNVVWQGYEGNDYEIFFYDGTNIIQLTNNNYDDGGPQISGNNIVWLGSGEIFFYDGNNTIQLTDNNPSFALNPQISGNNIVWIASKPRVSSTLLPPRSLVFYNGNSYETITPPDNPFETYYDTEISGNNVVWSSRFGGNDDEIFLYNGTTNIQLTNNSYDDSNPQIWGDKVVWQGYDGNDDEIYLTILENDDLYDLSEFYRFRNTNYDTGGYLFVGEEEKNAILANPDFNQTFELKGNGSPAFTSSNEPGDDLIPFYRLRSLDTPGTNLFVSTEEYNSIFMEGSDQHNKWVAEGLDTEGIDIPEFYLYGVGAGQGIEFHRFQDINNHSYLFAGPEETQNIYNDPLLSANFVDEGIAFEAFI